LKKTTAKLEKMVDEKTFILTAQNQNIEQFSFSLSHDLKNPINNIKGLVEILEDADEDSRPEITKMLMNSAILLEDKIKATLETIRQMQANKKNVEQLYFDTIFEETKKSLLILINENDVKFITDFKEKSFYYNQSILDSIFYNLVSNSIKYGSDERQKIVKITSEKIENDSIQLVFEDNGIGFDLEKDREKVFSIFERVHDQATGTGIGLYMVKQMIELNGGTIMVHSKINEGTVFKIILGKMR
jgi:signal transduction histidine kinase